MIASTQVYTLSMQCKSTLDTWKDNIAQHNTPPLNIGYLKSFDLPQLVDEPSLGDCVYLYLWHTCLP